MQPEIKKLDIPFINKGNPLFGGLGKYALQTEQDNYNPFLGYPAIPIVGRYGGAGYELSQTLISTAIPIKIVDHKATYEGCTLGVPKRIIDILESIPEMIVHNRPPKKEDKKHSKEDAEDEPSNTIDHHPFSFPVQSNFRLRIIISCEEAKMRKDFLNYVNHTYIFKNIDFSNSKRLTEYLPCCLIEPPEHMQSGIFQWKRDYKSINFTGLRSQYLSFHLKKGAPAFSPNNFKIGLKQGSKFIHFFVITLTMEEYCVNYHWHIIDKDIGKFVQNVTKNSKSLQQFVKGVEDVMGRIPPLVIILDLLTNQ